MFSLKKKVLNQILKSAPNLSEKNLIRSLKIGEKFLTKKEDEKQIIHQLIKLFKEKHPSVELAKRLKNLSKNCQNKLIENLFVNAFLVENQKRRQAASKLGFGLPWHFVISPTASCNLNCRGCYAAYYSKKEGLPYKELDRILKEARNDLHIHFIVISGGEPFTRKDLLKLFEKYNDVYFMVYTNGTLIDKKLANQLSKLGNVAPAISIEGFEKETDRRRGKGIFEKVIRAFANLKEAGVMFGFSVTATKINSEVISSEKFIDFLIKQGCYFGWFFQYVPIGRNPDVSLMSLPEQRNNLREVIKKWRATKPIFIGDFWNDGPFVGGCIAGARPGGYFHINCNGDVEPCVFLQFSVDNIKNKKLIEVIQSPFFKFLQEKQPYCQSKNLLTPCALIDNPDILREAVKKFRAKSSYEGGGKTVFDKKIIKFLDQYSKKMHKLTEPIWEKEYKNNSLCWKEYQNQKN